MTAVLDPGRTPDVTAAEKAVLGAIITSRAAAEQILELLASDDCFSNAAGQAVCAAVRHVTEEGLSHDPATILARLVAAEQGIWRTGDAGNILHDLIAHATPSYLVHARTVANAATQRRLLAALTTATSIAGTGGFTPGEHGEMARAAIEGALAGPVTPGGLASAADLFESLMARLETGTPPGEITPPWADLRSLLPYLRPGQLITIASRPTLGKSAAALDFARHTSIHLGLPAMLFTMEMSREEVGDRLLSAEASVPHDRITANTLTDEDWDRLAAAQDRIKDAPLLVDDTASVSLPHARARLRGQRHHPPKLVIFDYLQLMDAPKADNRQQEVSALVKGLKAIAREHDAAVLMLAQLNRGPEGRAGRRPFAADARESGSVENDSDVAILLHRPRFYEEGDEAGAEPVELIVDKNRNGRRGTATVGFQGRYVRFVDLAHGWTAGSAMDRHRENERDGRRRHW